MACFPHSIGTTILAIGAVASLGGGKPGSQDVSEAARERGLKIALHGVGQCYVCSMMMRDARSARVGTKTMRTSVLNE